MKFYDVNKYHLRPALNVAGTDIWLVNKKALAKLPEDIQKILVSTLEEHFWLRTNQYIYLENKTLSKVQKEKGVELITLPPEASAVVEASVGIGSVEVFGDQSAGLGVSRDYGSIREPDFIIDASGGIGSVVVEN